MALLPFRKGPAGGVATLAMVTRIGMISKGAAARFSTSSSFVSLSPSSTTSTRPLHHNFLQRRSPCHIIAAPSMVDDSFRILAVTSRPMESKKKKIHYRTKLVIAMDSFDIKSLQMMAIPYVSTVDRPPLIHPPLS